ncbi:hypothetical protein H257_14210 [Aphanomyces astaci]|uniref:Uncharacterized protein n=1 Tax=Aphanomyces astaci TaxID=112090 RepID=W4FRT0_APHAT|nr:hypothetical protein H257_14210 [Aphanomyces astaci]ETV70177.1 hypothetical protein H257_14210 [Aphanomyces astaci]|eukprot:XP_009840273.1 hypothetical protein H257_14210 [Aphanomyces astaci]
MVCPGVSCSAHRGAMDVSMMVAPSSFSRLAGVCGVRGAMVAYDHVPFRPPASTPCAPHPARVANASHGVGKLVLDGLGVG